MMRLFVPLFIAALSAFAFTACKNNQQKEDKTEAETVVTVMTDYLSERIDSCIPHIQLIFEYREPEERFKVYETPLYSSMLLPKVYVDNNFYPIWIKSSRDLDRIDSLIGYINELKHHGFTPSDYHLAEIITIREQITPDNATPYLISALDVLASDAFLLIASHLYNGKVNAESLKAEWGIQRQRPELALDQKLCDAVYSDDLPSFMSVFYPKQRHYEHMVKEVKRLTHSAAPIPPVKIPAKNLTLDVDKDSTYNYLLSKRIEMLGFMKRDAEFFEDSLAALISGIKSIQSAFGLIADGRIGSNTLDAINLTQEEKLKKLVVNMERMRWLPEEKSKRRILVNIADFTLDFLEDEDTIVQMRTVVGRDFRQTPVFEAKMTYLVFSPTWTVPPGILRNDVLPAIAKDKGYLNKNNMVILDRSGKQIDPASIDWQKARKGSFPYMVRQMPGDNNSLGRVKFMFPNKYNVYLHDTPSKNLFDRDGRTFSSGCIRIEKPAELAYHLLQDSLTWNSNSIRQSMALKNERTVVLKNPVGVYIYYLTAWGDKAGVQYRKDVYKRDEEVYKALISPYRPKK